MKSIKKIAILLLGLSISIASYSKQNFIPSQWDEFLKTGICINCDLSDVRIPSHNNANLTNALLIESNLSYGSFCTSNFSHAQMMYASFVDGQASGSNFTSANLTDADLSGTNFSSSNFTGANLTDADFSYANLARATISNEQLAQVKSLNCTIMPNGVRHSPDKGGQC